jgi:hypothetical protein
MNEPHQGPSENRNRGQADPGRSAELSKPENQQKIKDGLRKLQETAKSRR